MRAENKQLLHCIRLFTNFQCTPFLIRLQICPHVVKFESTFPPGEGILVRTELFAKLEFSSRNETERNRMGNDNFRTVHALAPRTAR